MEYFKDIPGYEGQYQISQLGRVTSLKRNIIMRHWTDKDGYKAVTLSRKNKRKGLRIHRLVLATFRQDSELPVNHINHIRDDNQLGNLEHVTVKENVHHCMRAGRFQNNSGRIPKNRRLTPKQIREIRKSTKTHKILALEYGVAAPNISLIRSRKSYKDVL